jgi:hypothetical protein
MTINYGDVAADITLYIPFASYNSDGASVTLTGLAVTDVEIFKDGSVTQRASDAGYALLDTDGIDFDGITGIHGFSIDLSDDTTAGFYAVGSQYWVVVSAVTIDAQTVNFIAATFRIVPAEASAGVPDVNVASIDANAITATSIAADAITAAKVAADVHAEAADAVWNEVISGHQTDSTFGKAFDGAVTDPGVWIADSGEGTLFTPTATFADATWDELQSAHVGAGSFGEIATEIAAILVDTAVIGAAGAGLTAVPWNADWDAEVQSEVEDALTAARAEPTGVPAANESLVGKVDRLFMALRNQVTITATKKTFFDDGGAAEWEQDLSDDGTTYTQTEANAP